MNNDILVSIDSTLAYYCMVISIFVIANIQRLLKAVAGEGWLKLRDSPAKLRPGK